MTGFERHKLPQEVYAPLREYWDTQQVGGWVGTELSVGKNGRGLPRGISCGGSLCAAEGVLRHAAGGWVGRYRKQPE